MARLLLALVAMLPLGCSADATGTDEESRSEDVSAQQQDLCDAPATYPKVTSDCVTRCVPLADAYYSHIDFADAACTVPVFPAAPAPASAPEVVVSFGGAACGTVDHYFEVGEALVGSYWQRVSGGACVQFSCGDCRFFHVGAELAPDTWPAAN